LDRRIDGRFDPCFRYHRLPSIGTGKSILSGERKAVNHIFSMQLPDGGWNIYYGGPSEVNATIKAYLALNLLAFP